MMLLDLFAGFLEVGLFAFGGGYGAIPLIRDVVLSRGWLEEDMLTYMIAVSESTPGPIMVNLATYVGSVRAGIPGALTATFAVVLPAFLIVVLILALMKNLLTHPAVQAVLRGLKPCITGIILATGATLALQSCFRFTPAFSADLTAIALTAVLAAVYIGSRRVMKRGLSPIGLILLSAAAGVLVYGWQ